MRADLREKSNPSEGRCWPLKNVLLVGVGGQGTILASKLLIAGLIADGYNVKMSEIHGMSQRGGAVSTHIRFGRENIWSPVVERGSADLLVAFEKLEAARFIEYLRVGGRIVLSDQEILTSPMLTGASAYPQHMERTLAAAADTICVPVQALASGLGGTKFANVILLGAAVKLLGLEDIAWDAVIKDNVRPEYAAPNIAALRLGMKEAASL